MQHICKHMERYAKKTYIYMSRLKMPRPNKANKRRATGCRSATSSTQSKRSTCLRCLGRPLFVAFVDVRRAFPSVRRELLWHKLHKLGASEALIRALMALYDDTCATVRCTDGLSQIFDFELGRGRFLFLFYCERLVPERQNMDKKKIKTHP